MAKPIFARKDVFDETTGHFKSKTLGEREFHGRSSEVPVRAVSDRLFLSQITYGELIANARQRSESGICDCEKTRVSCPLRSPTFHSLNDLRDFAAHSAIFHDIASDYYVRARRCCRQCLAPSSYAASNYQRDIDIVLDSANQLLWYGHACS